MLKTDRTSLLERCITHFSGYAEYRDDERFLNICLAYVRHRRVVVLPLMRLIRPTAAPIHVTCSSSLSTRALASSIRASTL